MNERDFCLWLQGYLGAYGLYSKQSKGIPSWAMDAIRQRLDEALSPKRNDGPPVNHDLLAERAPPPPADLVQATQDGEHPAIHAKRAEGKKAVQMPKGKETDR